MHPSSCILTSAAFLTNSSQQWRGEGDGLRGEGGEHSGHQPGVDDGGGDGAGPEPVVSQIIRTIPTIFD